MESLEQLFLKTKTLAVFNNLPKDNALSKLIKLIHIKGKTEAEKLQDYTDFTSTLYDWGENLTEYVWNLVCTDENIYVKKVSRSEKPSEMLNACVKNELDTIQELGMLTTEDIKKNIDYSGFLPEWKTNKKADFYKNYKSRIANLHQVGYGIYTNNVMFTYSNGDVVPVKYPDPIRLTGHIGYKVQVDQIMDNTLAFVNGKPAANTLLYGDAGTGKSSTVKAIVNEFADKGLRMIEVRKGDLLKMPDLIEYLADNPLKFILFIDDLSFNKDNEEIGALKAILEGSVSTKTSNVVIYATSNRRHLVQESFADRDDDVHRNETVQEQISLSDRFGLSICFMRPDKDEYLAIVHGLVKEFGVKNLEKLDEKAERHALERGGRSGRTARQFVEYLKTME